MSTVYGENGTTGTVSTPPQKVNFGWLGESWRMFKSNAGLWISAVLLGVFFPLLFDTIVIVMARFSRQIPGSIIQVIPKLPLGLLIGIGMFNLIYNAYIVSGLYKMAIKAVYGEQITFRDIFSGSNLVLPMLIYSILYSIITATTPILLIGLFLAGLLLPAYAMIADGYSIPKAIGKSMSAMFTERWIAAALVFVVWIILGVLSLTLIGIIVTMPMLCLISALAYRDMIGLRRLQALPVNETLPWEGESQGPPAMIHVEDTFIDDEETSNKAKRFSLTGEPLDDNGNVIPPK